MPRGKGPGGISCREAFLQAIRRKSPVSADELFAQVKHIGQGAWTDDHIWQEIMCHTVNLVPAYRHWPREERFLFQREDGSYELYDPSRHGDRWKGYP